MVSPVGVGHDEEDWCGVDDAELLPKWFDDGTLIYLHLGVIRQGTPGTVNPNPNPEP